MINLIKTEFKKLFKSRINLVLLAVLFVFTGYNCYKSYNMENHTTVLFDENHETIPSNFTLLDIEGNAIQGADYWRLADEVNHSYAGELSEERLTKMQEDFNKINNPDKTVDTAYMKKLYGNDYETKIAKAEAGRYTEDEFRVDFADYIKYTGGFSLEPVPNSDKFIFHPKTFTKADHVNLLYRNVYNINPDSFSTYTSDGTVIDEKNVFQDSYYNALMSWTNAKNLTDNQIFDLVDTFASKSKVTQTAYKTTMDVYTQRYKNSEKKMDSRIGNNLFIYNIANQGFLSLIILAIILSNIFAIEKQYKTDQIMIPTAKGNHRITTSKLLCGFLTALGIIIVQLLIALVFSFIYVPMRSLSLVYFSQSGFFVGAKEFLFTYWELIGNGILLIGFAALAIALLTMALSYMLKNRVATIIPILIFIFFGAGNFFSNMIQGLPLDNFLPTQMMSFLNFFAQSYDVNLPYTSIAGITLAWKDIIILFWLIVILIISFLMIRHSHRHVVKNC